MLDAALAYGRASAEAERVPADQDRNMRKSLAKAKLLDAAIEYHRKKK